MTRAIDLVTIGVCIGSLIVTGAIMFIRGGSASFIDRLILSGAFLVFFFVPFIVLARWNDGSKSSSSKGV